MIAGAYVFAHPPLAVSEVGGGQEKKIQKTLDAMHEAARQIAETAPQTVVLISPHSTAYGDYIHISPGAQASGDFAQFGARGVRMKKQYDTEMVSVISQIAFEGDVAAGTLGERDATLDHATMVPLWFVDQHYSGYRLVRIGISGMGPLAHYRLGKCIAQAAEQTGRSVVILASGDLSHRLMDSGPYGYNESGPEFDAQVTQALGSGDFLALMRLEPGFCEAAGECGLKSFITMAGALDGKAVDARLLSYEGPFGVGYAVCTFGISGSDESRRFEVEYERLEAEKMADIAGSEDEYVRLARASLETYVKTGRNAQMPDGLPGGLTQQKAGVFVSLKKHGRLRGCIGTTEPTQDSVAAEIIRNAVSAGTGDPRFDPVRKDELGDLVYSVDVLAPAEKIESMDELDPKVYGVIVSKGYRRGLLLPNLDGIDTPREQVKIALQKAGIGESENYAIERFRVVRHY